MQRCDIFMFGIYCCAHFFFSQNTNVKSPTKSASADKNDSPPTMEKITAAVKAVVDEKLKDFSTMKATSSKSSKSTSKVARASYDDDDDDDEDNEDDDETLSRTLKSLRKKGLEVTVAPPRGRRGRDRSSRQYEIEQSPRYDYPVIPHYPPPSYSCPSYSYPPPPPPHPSHPYPPYFPYGR